MKTLCGIAPLSSALFTSTLSSVYVHLLLPPLQSRHHLFDFHEDQEIPLSLNTF